MPVSRLLHFSVVCVCRGPLDRCSWDVGGSPKRQVSLPLETLKKCAVSKEGWESFADQHCGSSEFKYTDDLTHKKAPNSPEGLELL